MWVFQYFSLSVFIGIFSRTLANSVFDWWTGATVSFHCVSLSGLSWGWSLLMLLLIVSGSYYWVLCFWLEGGRHQRSVRLQMKLYINWLLLAISSPYNIIVSPIVPWVCQLSKNTPPLWAVETQELIHMSDERTEQHKQTTARSFYYWYPHLQLGSVNKTSFQLQYFVDDGVKRCLNRGCLPRIVCSIMMMIWMWCCKR